MSAELAARRTAAAAVLGDFNREAEKYLDDSTRKTPRPDMGMWAWRLSSELGSLLQRLDDEAAEGAPIAAAQLAKIRGVLHAFDWETGDRQYALEHIDDIVHGRPR